MLAVEFLLSSAQAVTPRQHINKHVSCNKFSLNDLIEIMKGIAGVSRGAVNWVEMCTLGGLLEGGRVRTRVVSFLVLSVRGGYGQSDTRQGLITVRNVGYCV